MVRALHRLGTLIVCIFCFSSLTYGSVYYVDFSAGNDFNSGDSQASPFKYAPGAAEAQGNAAQTTLSPGDIVVFRGGVVYNGRVDANWSGTSGNVITYRSGHKHSPVWGSTRAIIDGTGVALNRSTGHNGLISLRDESFITVDGFEITGTESTGNGFDVLGGVGWRGKITGGNIIVDDCEIHDGNSTGIIFEGGFFAAGPIPSGFIAKNLLIYNMQGHGFQTKYGIDDIVLEDSIIHDNGLTMGDGCFAAWGSDVSASNYTVRGNEIYNHPTKGPCLLTGDNLTVEGNYFHGTGVIGLTFKGHSNGDTTNVIVRNNRIEMNPTFEGLVRVHQDVQSSVIGLKVYNNTLIGCGFGTVIELDPGSSSLNPAIDDVEIFNNIVDAPAGCNMIAVHEHGVGVKFDSDFNHFRYGADSAPFEWEGAQKTLAEWQALGFDDFTHTQNIDPNLNADGSLLTTSSAIDAGLTLSGFSDDKVGVARPQGSAWDLGAYEFVGSPPGVPFTPTNLRLGSLPVE